MGLRDFFKISSFCYGTIEVDDIPAPLCFTVLQLLVPRKPKYDREKIKSDFMQVDAR